MSILFINTATGSGPAIGLALDECAPDIMDRPPVRHSIFTKEAIIDGLVCVARLHFVM
jgi:magnesium-transporting ATPase (P-type)